MIRQLQRRRTSHGASAGSRPAGNKGGLLRWTSAGNGNKDSNGQGMPGDSQRVNNVGDGEESTSQLVALYAQALDYPAVLCSKMQRKFKKHGSDVEEELHNTYRRVVTQRHGAHINSNGSSGSLLGQQQGQQQHQGQQQMCDAGCLEELVLSAMPEKNRQHCMEHLYSSMLEENEFFHSLVRAIPKEEHDAFLTRLAGGLLREHVAANRYLAISPRGAVYIVRRGAVRIFERGVAIATLERG